MNTVKYLMAVSLVLLAASCSKDADPVNNPEGYAPVTVSVNDFSMSMEQFAPRRAESAVANYTGVKAITLAFYDEGGEETLKTTQFRADNTTFETFGQFSFNLPMGSYTMVVLGYGSESEITLTSPTSAAFTADRVRETFAATQPVTVATTAPLDLSVTLNRIVSKLAVTSTDGRPAQATGFRTTFAKGGKSFNPTTGLATVNTGFENQIPLTTNEGIVTTSNNYLFLATDEQTMDVTIEVLDDDNNALFTKVIQNVPFKRNRVTRLTGSVFSASSSAAFTVETEWLPEYDDTF